MSKKSLFSQISQKTDVLKPTLVKGSFEAERRPCDNFQPDSTPFRRQTGLPSFEPLRLADLIYGHFLTYFFRESPIFDANWGQIELKIVPAFLAALFCLLVNFEPD